MRTLLGIVIVLASVSIGVAEPETGRTLSQTVILEAPVEDVWNGFTTADGIKKSWAVALAEVDFRMGGTIKTNYNEKGAIGDAGTITHHILAYEPQRMLSFHTDAPANAPEEVRLICDHGWVVVRMEPLSPTRTTLTETMMGFQEGPLWDKAYAFFEKGNAWTHDHMQEAFRPAGEAERVQKAWTILSGMAGGEWIYENKRPDGAVFRVRNRIEWGPGHKSLVTRGWLGGAAGMFDHDSTQAWLDGTTDQVLFHSIHQDGGTAAGSISLAGDSAIEWDWPETAPDGRTTRFVVTMTFSGADEYRGVLSERAADGSRTPVMDATFRRVAAAPDEFVRLRTDPSAAP